MEKRDRLKKVIIAMRMNHINVASSLPDNATAEEMYSAILEAGSDKYSTIATWVMEDNPMASMVF